MKILNFLKRKKADEIREVSFLKPSFKERLNSSRKKDFTVTVGVLYNGKVIRKFNADTKELTKQLATNKVEKGMSLKVIDVKRKRS